MADRDRLEGEAETYRVERDTFLDVARFHKKKSETYRAALEPFLEASDHFTADDLAHDDWPGTLVVESRHIKFARAALSDSKEEE